MQNLSISCALVCLIILGSAALVGAASICQRQISAILVTGVMYLLAGNLGFSVLTKPFDGEYFFKFSFIRSLHFDDHSFQANKRETDA